MEYPEGPGKGHEGEQYNYNVIEGSFVYVKHLFILPLMFSKST